MPKTNKIESKCFASSPKNLVLTKISFKVQMINSNFHIGYQIDRVELFKLIKEMKIECTYETMIHAGVNIKYQYNESKQISVFVFEKGSVIITGANNCDHIRKAYIFIAEILYNNSSIIIKSTFGLRNIK